MHPAKTSTVPDSPDIVTGWLAAESEATPGCEVVRAIQECTQGMKLDEGGLFARLLKLGKPEADTDAPR